MTARLFWLASYPKSGNTWFRTFLRNLETDAHEPASINDLGSSAIAASRAWIDELLGFDSGDLFPAEIARLRPALYRYCSDNLSRPAYRKIHDACHLVGGGEPIICPQASAGAVYFIRNPLDVAVSYAHHSALPIDEAIAAMADPGHCLAKDDGRGQKPQVEQRLLTWSDHVRSWVDQASFPVCVLRYEDMHMSGKEAFAAATHFLRLDHDRAAIGRAIQFSSFEQLKAQETNTPFRERAQKAVSFFRKGQIGDWQAALSSAQIERIVAAHGEVMQRFGYCDAAGTPQTM